MQEILLMAFVNLLNVCLPADGAQIRLAGGKCGCSGRVEVYRSSQWGTMCDKTWGMNDAAVVCRELGCGTAVSAPHGAQFGQGSGTVWMDGVRCTGRESSLSQCSHRRLGIHDCGHWEAAGAVCSDAVGNMRQPTLSLSSPYAALSPGNKVQFRCSAPVDICAPTEYGLYKGGAGSPLAQKPGSREASVVMAVNNVDASHQDSYTCLYTVQGSQTFHSPHSNSIAISIVVLQRPAIVLSSLTMISGPQGPEVIEGHNFTIICSTVPQYPGGTFHLSFSGSNQTQTKAAVNHSTSFMFSAAEFPHQGNYSCVYETTVSGRKFSSPASMPLPLTVTVVLQQPAIVLSSPAGEVISGPQGPEVIEGHNFTIICSAVPQYPGGTFHLSFSGSNQTQTKAAVNHSTSFMFSAAGFPHQGNYSCVYETTVSGHKFSSPASMPLPLTVTASLILPIIIGASAGLLVLVLLSIILFLAFRKRRHKKGHDQFLKTVRSERARDRYALKGKVSEEEDEPASENVETVTCNDCEYVIGDEDSGSDADYANYRKDTKNNYDKDEAIYENTWIRDQNKAGPTA